MVLMRPIRYAHQADWSDTTYRYLFVPLRDYDTASCRAVRAWCYETFGPPRGRWSFREHFHWIYIRRDADAMLFKLRWC